MRKWYKLPKEHTKSIQCAIHLIYTTKYESNERSLGQATQLMLCLTAKFFKLYILV